MLEGAGHSYADLLHVIVSMNLQNNSMVSYFVVSMLEGDRHDFEILHLVVSMTLQNSSLKAYLVVPTLEGDRHDLARLLHHDLAE